jgi:hypothetical protein
MVDMKGYHMSTLCGKNGFRHKTHDNMKRALSKMLRTCGLLTIEEEKHIFQDTANPECQDRPDISVWGLPGNGNFEKMVYDVSVMFPLHGQSMESVAARKNTVYRQRCVAKGIGFEPLIFESFGKLHRNVVNLITQACTFAAIKRGGNANDTGTFAAALSRHWLSVLSFTLQRSISTSIMSRVKILTSSRLDLDYSDSDAFVLATSGPSSLHHSEFDARQNFSSIGSLISHAFPASSRANNFGHPNEFFHSLGARH